MITLAKAEAGPEDRPMMTMRTEITTDEGTFHLDTSPPSWWEDEDDDLQIVQVA